MNTMQTLAEVGDKVAHPLYAFVGMLGLGTLVGLLASLLARVLNRSGFTAPYFLLLALAACAVALKPDLARSVIWDVVDADIRAHAINELGVAWLWETRLASLIGLTTGVGLSLASARWLARVTPRCAGECCAECGYARAGLTSVMCPECGHRCVYPDPRPECDP